MYFNALPLVTGLLSSLLWPRVLSGATKEQSAQLYGDLFTNYTKEVRPVEDSDDLMLVLVTFSLLTITEVS